MFSRKPDVGFLHEHGFMKKDIQRQCIEFEKILLEQNEDYWNYTRNVTKAVFLDK